MSENKFIGYEYRTISVPKDKASVYLDGYQNFGWEPEGGEEAAAANGQSVLPSVSSMTTLRFKRDRKIRNKAELTRLQRQFDACVEEIVNLERSKTTKAMIVSLSVGVIGCAFMAGSVFAVTAAIPQVVLSAVLAVPGFVCWILPFFLHQNLRTKRTAVVNPLVDKKYDEIYDVCEKGNSLLGK